MLKRPVTLCAVLLTAAVFLGGVVRLFHLRFDQGDLYPPYSTLRTDPLGASVLYESLDRLPDCSAERYFEPTFKNDDGRARALFVLGTQAYGDELLARSEFDVLQRFVFNGGRVVLAYRPQAEVDPARSDVDDNTSNEPAPPTKRSRHLHSPAKSPPDNSASPTNRAEKLAVETGTNHVRGTNPAGAPGRLSPRQARRHTHAPEGKDPADPSDEDELKAERLKYVDLPQEWGFGFQFNHLDTNDEGQVQFPQAHRQAPVPELPALLAIHTSLCFTNLTNGWQTVYQRDTRMPVVVERHFGAGSVVLVADAYPLSNEALFQDRSAGLLAWLLGSGRNVIFDEAHLGLVEQPGMATLMRRYHLHGLILGLALVAGLFVWKNSLSLVPPPADTAASGGPVIAGRDSASGLVNLMRRGIAPAELINVSYGEWKKAPARFAGLSPGQRRDVEQLIQQQAALEPHQRRPVENYRVISQILQRRN